MTAIVVDPGFVVEPLTQLRYLYKRAGDPDAFYGYLDGLRDRQRLKHSLIAKLDAEFARP